MTGWAFLLALFDSVVGVVALWLIWRLYRLYHQSRREDKHE